MISELNEPNLPRTSLTINRGTWVTRLVRIAQSADSEVVLQNGAEEETTRLLTNSLVCLNNMSYIIAVNQDTIRFIDDNQIYSDVLKFHVLALSNDSENISIGFSKRVQECLFLNQLPHTV